MVRLTHEIWSWSPIPRTLRIGTFDRSEGRASREAHTRFPTSSAVRPNNARTAVTRRATSEPRRRRRGRQSARRPILKAVK